MARFEISADVNLSRADIAPAFPRVRQFAALLLGALVFTEPRAADAEVAGPAEDHEVQAPQATSTPRTVGGFIDLEWRLLALADHASHGPAFAAGITLFQGVLRLGVGGMSRPGPLNPAEFPVAIPGGDSYKGKERLALRSDGLMAGVHAALSIPLPFEPKLALEVPVTVGYGGFGFYLQGEDRQTPDGRRVSAWEDELFDEKDAYVGVVVDASLRLRYKLQALPAVRPYIAISYTTVPGFETAIRNGYEGPGGAIGVQIALD
jgi:hypothetical protein